MPCECPKLVSYKQMVFDPEKIENPVLARVIRERLCEYPKFLHEWGDNRWADRYVDSNFAIPIVR